MHHDVIGDGAAVDPQGLEGDPRVLLHGVDDVSRLVGQGVQGGAGDMLLAGASGQAEDRSTGVHVPVRSAETGEGGDHVDTTGILDLAGVVFGVFRRVDHLEFVAQPLHRRAGDEDRSFQRIGDLAVEPPGDGGQQARGRRHRGLAGIHQQKTAGTVGVLDHALVEAGLAEQGGLLVTGDTGNGDLGATEHFLGGGTVDLAGWPDLGQHRPGNIEGLEQSVVPVEPFDVEQHGARGVGDIGQVAFAAGQVPHQPAVHGAKQQIAGLGALLSTVHLVEDPANLGGGEVGVDHQTGGVADMGFQPLGLELVA